MKHLIALITALAVIALPATAAARPTATTHSAQRSCGVTKFNSTKYYITAKRVSCSVARTIAGNYKVHDKKPAGWVCKGRKLDGYCVKYANGSASNPSPNDLYLDWSPVN